MVSRFNASENSHHVPDSEHFALGQKDKKVLRIVPPGVLALVGKANLWKDKDVGMFVEQNDFFLGAPMDDMRLKVMENFVAEDP